MTSANRTPLDAVAWLALEFRARPEVILDIFDSYDEFLGILGDDALRKRLEDLTPDTMAKDPLFPESRGIGDRFQRGLSALFFDTDRRLTDAVLRYGVF